MISGADGLSHGLQTCQLNMVGPQPQQVCLLSELMSFTAQPVTSPSDRVSQVTARVYPAVAAFCCI